MSPLVAIRKLIQTELDATDDLIRKTVVSDIPLATSIAEHIINSGGKRIRPIIVLLSAKACGYDGEAAITLAAIIELLHTATLLHDDVIDESNLRRGEPTANSQWGNEASVLVGDLLYARAFQLIASLNHPRITQIIADATGFIVEGEVMQLIHCKDSKTTEQTYLDIIQRKTGKLFEVASVTGPVLKEMPDKQITAMRKYGQNLGMAFQMLDDALDYEGDSQVTGKNIGDDLYEGKPTLPLIYVLKNGNEAQRQLVEAAVKHPEKADIAAIQTALKETESIEYTHTLAKTYIEQAVEQLDSLSDSPHKQALKEIAEFTIRREY